MEVRSVETFGEQELLDAIRRTRLVGFDGVQPYADATITVEALDPDDLAPAQRYVLSSGVATVLELRDALAPFGIDLFALDGGAWVRTGDGEDRVPVIPPIVEQSLEPDGRDVLIVNDGMHRVFAARSLGLPITVVVIRGVPVEYPYYATALTGGWPEVVELDELPDGFQKKTYRRPSEYRSLFRDFNALFPGVQQQRKQTNPDHLRA